MPKKYYSISICPTVRTAAEKKIKRQWKENFESLLHEWMSEWIDNGDVVYIFSRVSISFFKRKIIGMKDDVPLKHN